MKPESADLVTVYEPEGNDMRHEKTVSVSKIKHLWEPWEEDETPRKIILCQKRRHPLLLLSNFEW